MTITLTDKDNWALRRLMALAQNQETPEGQTPVVIPDSTDDFYAMLIRQQLDGVYVQQYQAYIGEGLRAYQTADEDQKATIRGLLGITDNPPA